MSFKDNLKSELAYQDMLVKELSAKTGINLHTLGNYLSGHNSIPNAEHAVKIAQALNVTVEYLVLGKDETESRMQKQKQSAASKKIVTLIKNFESLDEIDQEAVQNLVLNLKKRY